MFTANLAEIKYRQEELHRQAEYYRILKSLKGKNPLLAQFKNGLGRALVFSGEQLLTLADAAH